jgi:hypothetical protein
MGVSIHSGCDQQLIVEVAANERHECAAGRMNPADRQPVRQVPRRLVMCSQLLLELLSAARGNLLSLG